jgi:hypothetical protein
MLAVTIGCGFNAGVAAVSSCTRRAGGSYYYVNGAGTAALRNYLGHTVKAMSYLPRSTHLTLHLQSPSAASAAQHAAEEAAAAVEAAANWKVHQVRQVQSICGRQLAFHQAQLQLCDNPTLFTLRAC